jgi:hypothetical protein
MAQTQPLAQMSGGGASSQFGSATGACGTGSPLSSPGFFERSMSWSRSGAIGTNRQRTVTASSQGSVVGSAPAGAAKPSAVAITAPAAMADFVMMTTRAA